MAFYTFKARSPNGVLITGEIEAESAKEAKQKVLERDLLPVSAELKSKSISLPSPLRSSKKNRIKDLIGFTRQFATMFKAGVPMERILGTLSKQTPNLELKAAIIEIGQDISGGASLMVSFSKHPVFFNELYVNMLNVGEQGGVLDQALLALSEILKREHKIIRGVKSATLYPKIVVVAFILVVTLLMMFVMPGFANFYAGFGAELPLPTRIMIGLSDFFVDYWYILFFMIITTFLSYKKFASTSKGALILDRLSFKVPVFGKLNLMVANARFGHLVSELYRSGLPLSKTLTVVGNTIGNKVFKNDIDDVRERMEAGTSLSEAMKDKPYFTPLLIESVSVGEQSGALDNVLTATAEFYDEEVSDMLEQLTTLLEPILLVGLFAMISLLAFAVFMPIWKTTQLVLPEI
ncbi:MAG: type II secretion system F family protein [bacterium]|nr:type II secretion system F family protein [bacterium]MBU1918602.1 type II secretion system F family protein [bacterium]